MATKSTLTVTLPNGVKATRTTANAYTFAIVTGTPESYYRDRAAESAHGGKWYTEQADRAAAEGGVLWGVVAWTTRRDLADKRAAQARKAMPVDDVRIVAVDGPVVEAPVVEEPAEVEAPVEAPAKPATIVVGSEVQIGGKTTGGKVYVVAHIAGDRAVLRLKDTNRGTRPIPLKDLRLL